MSRITRIRLLLLIAIVLVFGQIVTHDFVDWDDGALIYNNDNLRNPTLPSLAHHWKPSDKANMSMYDPLVFTLWWGIAHFATLDSPDLLGSTLNPYLFHAASLVVHWFCACLVLEILLQLKIKPWASAAGALVFAIHPLQTETVAWATAMKDLLSGLFSLLVIWRYLVALQSEGKRRTVNCWIATLAYAAAVLSKPSTVVLPVMAAAMDRVLFRRSWRRVMNWYLGLWLVIGIGATITASVVQKIQPQILSPPWARPLVALDAISFYLAKVFVPLGIRFDYGRSPMVLLSGGGMHYALAWTWVLPVGLAVLIWRGGQKLLAAAGLIFLIGVLPVLGLKAFSYQYYTTVADRYVYLSMLGVAICVGWAVQRYQSRWVSIVTAVVIVVLGGMSFVYASRWVDTETLYSYGLTGTRSLHLLTLGDYQSHLAEPCFRRARQAAAAGNFAQATEDRAEGNSHVQQTVALYESAIELEPLQPDGYDRLARFYVLINHYSEAIETVKQWMALEPRMLEPLREPPGQLKAMLGQIFIINRQYPEAIAILRQSQAEKWDPDVQKMLDRAQKLLAMSATQPSTRK
jgi:hypothetical protein